MFPGMKSRFKFEKDGPAFGTVVQYCVAMAIYMGFKDIYMLGIDGTGIITNINSAMKNDVSSCYGYCITQNEKVRMQKMMEKSLIEDCVRTYLREIEGYSFLKEYCDRKKIKLVNCSYQSAIQELPRKKLRDVLEMGKTEHE
jgi:hypothetical protein